MWSLKIIWMGVRRGDEIMAGAPGSNRKGGQVKTVADRGPRAFSFS
jgi:hypothetical protein